MYGPSYLVSDTCKAMAANRMVKSPEKEMLLEMTKGNDAHDLILRGAAQAKTFLGMTPCFKRPSAAATEVYPPSEALSDQKRFHGCFEDYFSYFSFLLLLYYRILTYPR